LVDDAIRRIPLPVSFGFLSIEKNLIGIGG